jgi:hypothetical protein
MTAVAAMTKAVEALEVVAADKARQAAIWTTRSLSDLRTVLRYLGGMIPRHVFRASQAIWGAFFVRETV